MIRSLLEVYIFLLILDSILSFFPDLMKHTWRRQHKRICDFTCNPIRKRLPTNLPFDFSPILVILLIEILMYLW